jgi:hypothetical protein
MLRSAAAVYHLAVKALESPHHLKKCTDPYQDAQQDNAESDAPSDESFFHRKQRLLFHFLDFIRKLWF